MDFAVKSDYGTGICVPGFAAPRLRDCPHSISIARALLNRIPTFVPSATAAPTAPYFPLFLHPGILL